MPHQPLGAVIHMGAGIRRLTMAGQTWDLINLSRPELTAAASLLSDSMGLTTRPSRPRLKHRKETFTPA